jgi:hypothetical protein
MPTVIYADLGTALEIANTLPPMQKVEALQDILAQLTAWQHKQEPSKYKFPLGSLAATPGVVEMFHPDTSFACLERHRTGDWGDVTFEDAALNDAAVNGGGRLLSTYTVSTRSGDPARLWFITEADRSATTALLPDEY